MQEALADTQNSQGRIDRCSDNESVRYVQKVVTCSDNHDVCVLVGHLTNQRKDLCQAVAPVFLKSFQVWQGCLEENFTRRKVENKKRCQNFDEQSHVLVTFDALLES